MCIICTDFFGLRACLKFNFSPFSYLEYRVVFVLPCAVVCMEGQLALSKTVVVKKVVEEADDCVGALSRVTGFVDEVMHLPGNSLATHSKHRTLPRGLEVDGPRLHGVVRVVHLLGKVKGVVHPLRPNTRRYCRASRRRGEHVIYCVELVHSILGVFHCCPVVGPLTGGTKMFLCCSKSLQQQAEN